MAGLLAIFACPSGPDATPIPRRSPAGGIAIGVPATLAATRLITLAENTRCFMVTTRGSVLLGHSKS